MVEHDKFQVRYLSIRISFKTKKYLLLAMVIALFSMHTLSRRPTFGLVATHAGSWLEIEKRGYVDLRYLIRPTKTNFTTVDLISCTRMHGVLDGFMNCANVAECQISLVFFSETNENKSHHPKV